MRISAQAGPSSRIALIAIAIVLMLGTSVAAQDSDKDKNDNFDVQSSVGNMHLGSDASPRELGLPVYPGARVRKHDDNRNNANLSIFTSAFGFKLLVANYDSDDNPDKIIGYYRDKLKKYGKVLECRTSKHGGNISAHADNDEDSSKSKELKCDDDDKGNVIELKVGTEDDQHVVAIEPGKGSGATFALVYVHARGKQGDI
jgi:hypothetical protein